MATKTTVGGGDDGGGDDDDGGDGVRSYSHTVPCIGYMWRRRGPRPPKKRKKKRRSTKKASGDGHVDTWPRSASLIAAPCSSLALCTQRTAQSGPQESLLMTRGRKARPKRSSSSISSSRGAAGGDRRGRRAPRWCFSWHRRLRRGVSPESGSSFAPTAASDVTGTAAEAAAARRRRRRRRGRSDPPGRAVAAGLLWRLPAVGGGAAALVPLDAVRWSRTRSRRRRRSESRARSGTTPPLCPVDEGGEIRRRHKRRPRPLRRGRPTERTSLQ